LGLSSLNHELSPFSFVLPKGMSLLAKVPLNQIASGYRSANALNADLEIIQDAFDNTLSRDGSGPNQMESVLDMNDNQIINVGAPVNNTDAIRKIDLDEIVDSLEANNKLNRNGNNASAGLYAAIGEQTTDLTAATDVQDADLLASYRASGPLKRVTAETLGNYVTNTLAAFIQAGTGAILRTISAKMRDTLDVRDFGVVGSGDEAAKIQAALNHARDTGQELLWPGGSYSFGTALSIGAVRIRFTSPVTLTYTGTTHVATAFSIGMAGSPTSLLGRLTVNANNKANVGLRILNESATRADLTLGDVKAINCLMVSGGPSGGATGVIIRGNIDTLFAPSLQAENIDREAGTGSLGNNGTAGIEIGITGGYGVRNIRVGTYIAKTITTQDAPGVAACADVDGILIQQLNEDDCSFSFEQMIVHNAQGRGVKAQVFKNLRAGSISVFRNIEGITGGSTEVAFQYGEGVAPQTNVRYTGLADTVHGRGTTVLSAYTATNRADGYGVIAFENLTVKDETTGGTANINALFDIGKGVTNTAPVVATISNTKLIGRAANYLVATHNTGGTGFGRAIVMISGFIGELALGLFRSSSTKTNDFRAVVSGVINTGATVPALVADVGSVGNSFGRLVDAGGNIGIKQQTTSSDTPGIACEQRGRVTYASASQVSGWTVLLNQSLAAGATFETELVGLNKTHAAFWAGSSEFGHLGLYVTDGNTITTVIAGTGVVVSSTGSEPASGSLRIWKSDSGQRFSFKNNDGNSRLVYLEALA